MFHIMNPRIDTLLKKERKLIFGKEIRSDFGNFCENISALKIKWVKENPIYFWNQELQKRKADKENEYGVLQRQSAELEKELNVWREKKVS